MPIETLQIQLTLEELQLISDGLQFMPLGKAGPLVFNINKQISEIKNPIQPEELPEVE